ncbi:MAG: YfbM family protein [Pirellulales bacterium]
MSMIGNFLQLSSAQLEALIADPSRVETFIYPEDEEHVNGIHVDKAWHGIHYLLAGEAWGGELPLANVVLGGTEIGEDVGYGPARYLTADEVRAAADALKDITPDVLRSRYVASELSENAIYPDIWDDPDDDAIGYLATWYQTLRDYYFDAAAKRNAMLKYLN